MSRGTLLQAGLLSGTTASNSCRKNIGLTKLSADSTLYRMVAKRRGILLLLHHISRNLDKACTEPERSSSTSSARVRVRVRVRVRLRS